MTAALCEVDDIMETADRRHGIGLEVHNERIVRREHRRPCDLFEGDPTADE